MKLLLMRLLLPLFAILCLCIGCTQDNTLNTGIVSAYVPVYMSTANASKVSVEPSRAIAHAGKIYVYGNWLFENDVNTGIHIIDISNRSNPVKRAFINIPFSTEVAVKGNFLYTNNLDDLLTFDISNPAAPFLVKRIEDVFPVTNQQYPPFNRVSFECADASKGIVVKWELKQIENPKCRR